MHILTCSKCKTQFSIPLEALMPKGRKVRCGSCEFVWFETPPGFVPPPPPQEEAPKKSGSDFDLEFIKNSLTADTILKDKPKVNEAKKDDRVRLPARAKDVAPIKASLFSQTLSLTLILLAFVLGVLVFSKSSSWFVELKYLFNLYDSVGVEIETVGVERNQDIDTMDLKIQLKNTTDKIKEVKFIRVTLLGGNDKVIREYMFEPDENIVEPNANKQVVLSIFNPSDSAVSVIVDIGNKWDFMFR